VPCEKMYGLGCQLILGKVCFRYISWVGAAELCGGLRLTLSAAIAESLNT